MSTTPTRQLWTPTVGINFTAAAASPNRPNRAAPSPSSPSSPSLVSPTTPTPNVVKANQPLYPTLGLARFIHNEAVERIHEQSVKAVKADAIPKAVPSPPARYVARKATTPAKKRPAPDKSPETKPRKRVSTPRITWDMAFPKPMLHPGNDLGWKIPDESFAESLKEIDGKPLPFYSHEMYRGPGRLGHDSKVTVHYCRSVATSEAVCKEHFLNEPVIGFDLEWEMNATEWDGAAANVSLIQIATASRIGLFHTALFKNPASFKNPAAGLVAPSLKKILEDPTVIKCGVWILGDFARLRKYLNLSPRGAIDLSHYHNLVVFCKLGMKGAVPKRGAKLADQVQQVLGLPMFKGMDIRGGHWSQSLSTEQKIYSATDAYAGLQLYAAYDHQRLKLRPCPPRPPLAELGLKIETKGEDGIGEDEELAFIQAEQEESGTVTLDDKTLASKTTRTIAHATKTEETEKGRSTTTTIATATITTTTFTTITNKKQEPPAAQPSAPVICISDPPQAPTPAKTTTGNRRPRVPKISTANSSVPHDPRVRDAAVWAHDFRVMHNSKLATIAQPTCLRAYRLWNANPDLCVPDVAALMRDPPLKLRTVVNYIIDVVHFHGALREDGGQGLEVDHSRFCKDVLGRVNNAAPQWMLDALGQEVDGIEGATGELGADTANTASGDGGGQASVVEVDDGNPGGAAALGCSPILTDNASSTAGLRPDEQQERQLDQYEGRDEGHEMSGSIEGSTSPTPSETELLFALDDQLGEATQKGEMMKMSRGRETWGSLGVDRDGQQLLTEQEFEEGAEVEAEEVEGNDEVFERSRSVSPSPSEMEVLMEVANGSA